MRSRRDFQPSGLAAVKTAGFTGVFVNGGAGIGPDMMPPESAVITQSIPELMPLTAKANIAMLNRQAQELVATGLEPWLNVWGVPGPDESTGGSCVESNRLIDRRSKLEMRACLDRRPELFGLRNPGGLSWRGSRPL